MDGWLFDAADSYSLERERVTQHVGMRHYQRDAIAQLSEAIRTAGRTLGVLATGSGKTEILIEIVRRLLQQDDEKGALIITPRDPLVWQTAERFRNRGIPCGVELGTSKSYERVTIACYNSLLSRRRFERFCGTLGFVCVDEVHTNYSKRSLKMLDSLTQGGVGLLGLTASPERAKGDPLTKYYGGCGYYYPIAQATADGWLVPSKVWLSVLEGVDFSTIPASVFGDFDEQELGRVMAQENIVQQVASLIAQHWDGLPSVVFCASIHQTELLIDVLSRRGIHAVMVHSKMDDMERKLHLSDFESGKVDVIVNVGVLTLGWDSPRIRRVFLCKPTKSRSSYIQQYGRGPRPEPGILDDLPELHQAEQRKARIAASRKPDWECFDLTDSSRHCDLVTAIDIFAPDLEPELKKRARKRQASAAGPLHIDEVVAAAQAEAAAEAAARDQLEWERRAGITVDHEFGSYERDVNVQTQEAPPKKRGWVMILGVKHRGKPLHLVPTGYLKWVLTESKSRNEAFLLAIRREIAKRENS
jgi:superfamily II DNA or RNA helicase